MFMLTTPLLSTFITATCAAGNVLINDGLNRDDIRTDARNTASRILTTQSKLASPMAGLVHVLLAVDGVTVVVTGAVEVLRRALGVIITSTLAATYVLPSNAPITPLLVDTSD